jgi:hypothetical protein
VIFGERVAVPYLNEIVDPSIDVPASIVAERSTAPESLLSLVRFHGSPHAEFDSWKAGGGFVFKEPHA